MDISIILSNCPRKITGGHKVIFEYANYLAKNNNVTIYFGYDEVYCNYNIPSFLRPILARTAIKHFRPSWFKFSKNVKKICVDEINNMNISCADVVIATDVKTARPVNDLDASKGKKFYFVQGFENWVLPDDEVIKTFQLNMNIIVVSKWLKNLITSNTYNKNIYYVANSIDTNIFKAEGEKNKRKDHSIIFQYRSAENKGCRYALEVISKLKERYIDLSVTIVSNEKRPKCIPSWCNYFFNVSQSDVARLNSYSQVFLLTSIEEGFGLPGLEAMACGCALVSFEFNGVLEYAVDGYNSVLVPVRDVNTMVSKTAELLENDVLRLQLSRNGINTGKKYNLSDAGLEFEKVLSM